MWGIRCGELVMQLVDFRLAQMWHRPVANAAAGGLHWRVASALLDLSQLGELIDRDRGQLAVVPAENEDVAIDPVVEVAVEVEGVAATVLSQDGADRFGVPVAKPDLDFVGHFHAVARLKRGKRLVNGWSRHRRFSC